MIGVLIFPDFQLLDAAGPISVFEIASRYAKTPADIKVIAAKPGAVRSTSGVELLARKFGAPGAISTLLIVGGEGVDAAARNLCTLQYVRAVAKRGVRVNSISPGYIGTEMTKLGMSTSGWYQNWLQFTPMGRLGEPREVASVVVFLASDASSYFTGSNLVLFLGKEPNLNWRAFGDCILELARKVGVRRVLFVGSFGGAVPHTREPRLYAEVVGTWKTSCPRLTIWEDAADRGYVARETIAGFGLVVTATQDGEKLLRANGRTG